MTDNPPDELVRAVAKKLAISEHCYATPRGNFNNCGMNLGCGWGACNIQPDEKDRERTETVIAAINTSGTHVVFPRKLDIKLIEVFYRRMEKGDDPNDWTPTIQLAFDAMIAAAQERDDG